MAERLTDQRVRSLKADRRLEIRDADATGRATGLILRLTPRGGKTWCVLASVRGRRLRVTIGPYSRWSLAEARQEARRILQEFDRGATPRRRRPAADTVRSLGVACLWASRRRLRPETRRQWVRLLRRELLPEWGTTDPMALERGAVQAWLARIAARAPYVANQAGWLLHRVCAWGVEQEMLPRNPCQGVRRPHRVRPRERVLSLVEARQAWAAAGRERRLGPAVQLLLLTAARLREVLGMQWAELQLEGEATWSVRGVRRKGGDALVLPLVPDAVAILRRVRRGQFVRSDWVFPSPTGCGPVHWASHLAARVRARAGVAFQLHDLRRTVASHLAAHGTPVDIIEAILGHRRPLLVRTYQRYAPLQAMREALEWWAGKLG